MATSSLYGSVSESTGLYGIGAASGGTYFEWFIFYDSATAPATPTGGSWSFTTNNGIAPTGWLSAPPAAPVNQVWVSIAIVDSRSTSSLVWSTPGLMTGSGLPILTGSGAPSSGTGLNGQLYINTATTPQSMYNKQSGAWVQLTGASLYATSGVNSNITGLTGLNAGGIATPTFIQMSTAGDGAKTAGKLQWDPTYGGPTIGMSGGNVNQNIGQDGFVYVYNNTGSTINKGQVVYISGSQGQRLTVALAQANSDATSISVLGFAAEAITNNNSGFVATFGLVENINTSGFADGASIWLSPTTPGGFTTTKPVAPNHLVLLGYVVKGNSVSGGSIYVFTQNGYELDELHDVRITSLANRNLLQYDSSVPAWVNIPGPNGSIVGTTDTQTLTNKTISGANNTLSSIPNSALVNDRVTVNGIPLILGANQTIAASWLLPSYAGNAGKVLAVNPSASDVQWITAGGVGTVTSVDLSTGSTGLTATGGPITAAGTITLGGTLNVANGGTGVTTSTGTGSVVLSNSPTLVTPNLGTPTAGNFSTGTFTWPTFNQNTTGNAATATTATNVSGGSASVTTLTTSSVVTLNGGTANGVAYLNGSKVLTTGSALTFSGNTLTVGGATQTGYKLQSYTPSGNDGISILNGSNGAGDFAALSFVQGGNQKAVLYTNQDNFYITAQSGASIFSVGGEQMRLTSTGLGIGTSSPAAKLQVKVGTDQNLHVASGGGVLGLFGVNDAVTAPAPLQIQGTDLRFNTGTLAASERMRLSADGNLGIGTSSPAARLDVVNNSTYQLRVASGTGNYADAGIFLGSLGTSDANYWGAIQYLQSDQTTRIVNKSYSATGGIDFYIGTTGTPARAMKLDSFGNLGLGVTPSAWGSYKAFQNGGTSVADFGGANNAIFGSNMYFDGSAFRYIGTSFASSYRQVSGQHQWYTAPSGTAGNAISFTQAMTLDASGNLGVGTTAPSNFGKLAVVGTIAPASPDLSLQGLFSAANTGEIRVGGYKSGGGTYLVFSTGADTERARIDSSGNLLVNTTSPIIDSGRRLSVVGGSVAGSFKVGSTSDIVVEMWNAATSGDNIFSEFKTEASPTYRGAITYNRGAGLVAYNTTSDYRAKDIYGNVTDSGAVIDSVPVYMGKMKGATQERPMFIAHETPAYAHTGEKDAVDADGNPVYQQMDASALVPVMWAEIQSLRKRLAAAGIA